MLFSGTAYCQAIQPGPDCTAYLVKQTDRMTGQVVISAPKTPVKAVSGSKAIAMGWFLTQDSSMVVLSLILTGVKCVDNGEVVNVLFTDGTRQAFMNASENNCEGRASLRFDNTYKKKFLDMMATKQIQAIRVNASEDYVEVDLAKEGATKLMRGTACIREYLK